MLNINTVRQQCLSVLISDINQLTLRERDNYTFSSTDITVFVIVIACNLCVCTHMCACVCEILTHLTEDCVEGVPPLDTTSLPLRHLPAAS